MMLQQRPWALGLNMQHTENKLDMTVLHATTTELQHMTKKGVISTLLLDVTA